MPKHNYSRKRKQTKLIRKNRKSFKTRGGKKRTRAWRYPFIEAEKTLRKTKSLAAARQDLKKQTLLNAQRLFGNVGEPH